MNWCRISTHPEALKAGAANGDLPGRETEQERVGMPWSTTAWMGCVFSIIVQQLVNQSQVEVIQTKLHTRCTTKCIAMIGYDLGM